MAKVTIVQDHHIFRRGVACCFLSGMEEVKI